MSQALRAELIAVDVDVRGSGFQIARRAIRAGDIDDAGIARAIDGLVERLLAVGLSTRDGDNENLLVRPLIKFGAAPAGSRPAASRNRPDQANNSFANASRSPET